MGALGTLLLPKKAERTFVGVFHVTTDMSELSLPLVGSVEESEPSTVVLVTFAIATTLFGTSACAIVHCVHGMQAGEHWYQGQLVQMGVLHGASLAVVAATAWAMRKVRLKGCFEKEPGIEHRWDTVKWTLTMVVAWSHIGIVFYDRLWFQVLQTYKEFWLMQTYFFISGYLSSPEPTAKRLQAVWRSLVGAYFVNQVLYWCVEQITFRYSWDTTRLSHTMWGRSYDVEHSPILTVVWQPTGPLWYLPNLMGMRLIAPWWMQLKWPLVCAVILQLVIMSMKENDFNTMLGFMATNSMLTLFPFYVSGIIARRYSKAVNRVLDWKGARLAGLASSLTFLGFCYANCANQLESGHWFGIYTVATNERLWFNWNTGRLTACFESILGGRSAWLPYAWYIVIGGNVARYTLMFATVALFSRRDPVVLNLRIFTLDVTARGKRSISNYLMHYYVLMCLDLTFWGTNQHYGPLKIIGLVVIVILQSNLWMWLPVYNIVRPIFLAPSFDRLLLPADDTKPPLA